MPPMGGCCLPTQPWSEPWGSPWRVSSDAGSASSKHDANCHKVESAVSEVASSGTPQELELVIYSPEGESRYHHIKLVPEPGPDGQAVSVLAVGHDLTELKVAAEEVRLFASVFRSSAEGVLITDSRGTIISVNPAFTQITGYSADEALGNTPRMLRSDRQPPEFYTAMWEQIHREGQWQGEIWNRRKDGEAFLEWLTINRIDGEDGRPVRYAAVFHDITELRLKDEHIEHLAFHDALTGLPNRELLLERIHQAVKHSRAKQNRFSVTFIDLDRFKGVNDALGHDIGDCLLQIIGERIKRRLRKIDTVARVGGDEFVVLMENLNSPRQCASMAQILLDDIARPIELPGYKLEISASMGMGFFPEDGDESIELMKRADMAMYAAKAAGGNTYRFFRDEMLERTSHRLNMEMDLRRATVQNELELFYQPKIAFADDSVVGVEALVRWRHPEKGMQSPGEFIPLAEESTLICDIGAWVINEACRQVARWRSQGLNLPIAINISARQLETQDLLTRIRNLTKLHEVPISQIELELTESVIMEDPETVSVFLRQCREAGMRVAVDDFGTGYSSLAYLRRLPLDVLKIDRSFVLDAVDDEEDAQIVKTILALGQSLKLEVVAEGIETEAQAALLRRYGCDIAQGYLHARPMPATEFEHWIKTYQSSLS
ncbi:MAG: diguanylate cyclase [Oceanospirillaceae bacterium]|nr:diguanylate cyclase [Oceanospirillaceae bacterium]